MSVFDRSDADDFARGARALIVYPELPKRASVGPDARLAEAEGLALAIGLNVVRTKHYRVRSPRAVTLLGGGQVEEITEMGREFKIDLLIVDASLTAIQQRNLEDKTGLKTIDRTGLILEIFGERAATAEGRLQVELHISIIRQAGWCAAGPIWNGSVADSVFLVAPVKRRSRPIDG